MKKIPIYFKKAAFNNAVEIFKQKTHTIKQIHLEFKKLLKTDDALVIDYADIKQDFLNKLFEQKKEVNSLNVAAEKLADLLNLDTTHLDELQSEINPVISSSEPTKDDFTIFAETETEIEKFKLCCEIIKIALVSHEAILKIKPTDLRNFLRPFDPLLIWNDDESTLIGNPAFIKNPI